LRYLGAFGLALLAGGCGTLGTSFIPTSGPSGIDVKLRVTSIDSLPYGLVRLNPDVVHILSEWEPRGIAGSFQDQRPPPEIRFGIGDVVSVSIFEAAAGGLFIPTEAGVRPGNFVTLPNQPVDINGNISVPYAGAIRAAGRTPVEIQRSIVDAIKNRAIEPQAIVALVTQNTSLISVLGEVNTPNRFPALPAGEHILDSITRGGGIKDQGYESWVMLERGGRRAAVPFGDLIFEPRNNIWTHPADTIYIYREPQTFLALGAAGQQGQVPFQQWRITLAEGVAKAGGLLDIQADPASVFLYRREPRELAEKLGVDCSKFAGETVPVIYSVSFRDPAGFFLATKMQMRDKDILYAANAPIVEMTKLVQFLALATAAADNAAAAGTNVESWRIQSHIH
jgi:polysaccharide export outer membrane protein